MSFLKNILESALDSGFAESGEELGDIVIAHDKDHGDKPGSKAVALKIALKNGVKEWSELSAEEMILLAKLAREEEKGRLEAEKRALEAKRKAKAKAKARAKAEAPKYQHTVELGATKVDLARQIVSLQAQVSDLQGQILELENRSASTIKILRQLADALGLYK